MSGWNDGIARAINYIEENLTEELDINDIASMAYVSPFYFQKIFVVLCGFSVGEYIRNRKLSLAGVELNSTNAKVIDVALKYGYESPDSFTRAFTKFHGISPSSAKEKGALLHSVSPLKINLSLEGGTVMNYKILHKSSFTVMGKKRRFNNDTAYQEVPKYWQEHCADENETKKVAGAFGICWDENGKDFDYYIADTYCPWMEIPEGCETKVIPENDWAVFPCNMSTLQETNTKVWKEWFPSNTKYKLNGNYNVELYAPPEPEPENSYAELWFPVALK